MYPKLLKVKSIRGFAAYVLRDRDNPVTQERVEWTHTLNVPTANPETAWRVMEATDMDSSRLKAQAGLPSTGRKVSSAFRHLVLSWHPEQRTRLTKEDMILAAEGALKILGAHKCQTLVVAHNDTPHPHIHIVYNRVSPETGIALPEFNNWKKLSRWAQSYERQHGKIYFEQRVLNNQARDRGEYPEKSRGVPRQIMEADKVARQAANDNPNKREALKKAFTLRIRALAADAHALKRAHADQWHSLQAEHRALRRDIDDRARKAQAAARREIVDTFRPLWKAMHQARKEETAQFKAREATRLGRISNLLRNIDIARSAADGPRPSLMTRLWRGLMSSAERQALLEQSHARQEQQLLARQRADIRQSILPIAVNKRLERYAAAQQYKSDRADLAFKQTGERAKIRAQWHQLSLDRKAAYEQLSRTQAPQQTFNQAADPAQAYRKMLAERGKALDQQKPAREQNNDQEQEHD